MKTMTCHVTQAKTYQDFMDAITQDIALVKDYVKEPLLQSIKRGFFQPTMFSPDTVGKVHVAIGKCDHCGQYWVMNTVYFADDDHPGLYMDFVYTETLANAEQLIKEAKTTDDLSNSDYTTFAFDNYRRINVFVRPPYTDKAEGDFYVLKG